MTNSRVACSNRYAISGNRIGHEMVSLEVGRGDDSEVLEVKLRQLRDTSDYFHSQLHGASEYFVVPDGSPRLFRIYVEFLRTGRLHHPDSDETTDQRLSFRTLIKIFEFAKHYQILRLRNATLDEFLLRIMDNPDRLPYKYIYDIYTTTSSNSSLRGLVVDVIVNIGMKRDVQDWEDELPKGFMMDCLTTASEGGIVPFNEDWSEEDVSDWLDEMKAKLCDLYHVHDFEPRAVRTSRWPHKTRKGKRARRRQEEAARERLDEDEDGEIDPERQKWVDDEAADRMRYLMEPLPPRQRY